MEVVSTSRNSLMQSHCCSWTLATLWFFLPPFQLTLCRREKRIKGATISLDYFLLIRGIPWGQVCCFLSAYLISICLFTHDYLTNCSQQHLVTTGQPNSSSYLGIYISSEKSPRNPYITRWKKLPTAGKITPLLEHRTNHGQLL